MDKETIDAIQTCLIIVGGLCLVVAGTGAAILIGLLLRRPKL